MIVNEVRYEIDWKAYFYGFCDLHGVYVEIPGNRLLFPDGWQYNSTDYAGPEYPPPQNPDTLKLLKLRYWKTRKRVVEREIAIVDANIKALQEQQTGRSSVLYVVTRVCTMEGDESTSSAPADIQAMEDRIEYLKNDLVSTEEEIFRLKGDS